MSKRNSELWSGSIPGTAWLLVMAVSQQFRNDPYYTKLFYLVLYGWIAITIFMAQEAMGMYKKNVKSPFQRAHHSKGQ